MINSIVSKILAPVFVFAAVVLSSGQAFAQDVVLSGEFVGKSDHITTGAVTVEKIANGYLVKLGGDFSLDGAPDPSVGFGKDGTYDADADVGNLASKVGEQTYLIPASVDISKYNEVYIWCGEFSVPLGVATLN